MEIRSTELSLSGAIVPLLSEAQLSSIRKGIVRTLSSAEKVQARTSYSPLVRQLHSAPIGDEILIELPCRVKDANPNLLLIGSLLPRAGAQAFLFPQVRGATGIDNLKMHIMVVGTLVDNAVQTVLTANSSSQHEAQVKLLASLQSLKSWLLNLKFTPNWTDYKLTHHVGYQGLTDKVLVTQEVKRKPARQDGQTFFPSRIARIKEYDAKGYQLKRTSFEISTNDQVQVTLSCSQQAPVFGVEVNLYSLRISTNKSLSAFIYSSENDAKNLFQALEARLGIS